MGPSSSPPQHTPVTSPFPELPTPIPRAPYENTSLPSSSLPPQESLCQASASPGKLPVQHRAVTSPGLKTLPHSLPQTPTLPPETSPRRARARPTNPPAPPHLAAPQEKRTSQPTQALAFIWFPGGGDVAPFQLLPINTNSFALPQVKLEGVQLPSAPHGALGSRRGCACSSRQDDPQTLLMCPKTPCL